MRADTDSLVLFPYQLAIMYSAFDAAWRECAPDYEGSARTIEVGRLRLANAVLAAYQSGVRNTPMITAAALRTMRLWKQDALPLRRGDDRGVPTRDLLAS
jgi:hypothetical protein